jgi:hypothetical protein
MPSYAQDGSDTGWEFSIVPYGWFIGITGDVTTEGEKTDVDMSFSDILDNLDIAGQMQIEARKGRWGIFLQPNYLKVSDDGKTQGIKTDITIQTLFTELGGFYRARKWNIEGNSNRPVILDLLVGGRYWDMKTEIELRDPVSGMRIDETERDDFVDPFIGFRLGVSLTNSLMLNLRWDMGGFDITSESSNFTWNALAVLGYEVSKVTTLYAGYRGLGLDHNNADITIYGPLVGAGFRF